VRVWNPFKRKDDGVYKKLYQRKVLEHKNFKESWQRKIKNLNIEKDNLLSVIVGMREELNDSRKKIVGYVYEIEQLTLQIKEQP
jgi:hypothetical protein